MNSRRVPAATWDPVCLCVCVCVCVRARMAVCVVADEHQ